MSSKETRARNAAELDRYYLERAVEEGRKADLTMWERIEEADASGDVKEILHMIASHSGLEK
jgi:hypothetical protein